MNLNLNESPTQEMLSLRPDVVATGLDAGAVLLDLDTKYFYALNASGWALVQLFEAAASFDEARAFALACGAPDGDGVERQAEPLQQVIVSAFDPSIPLAE